MKRVVKDILIVVMFGISSNYLYAKPSSGSTLNMKQNVKVNAIKLIDLAGRQRMLSQRIAKNYLYIGKNIATDRATKQLKESLREFRKNQGELFEMIDDPEIKNLLSFVSMSLDELENVIKRPFSLDNAQLVLDLSESILEGSQYVVNSIKSLINNDGSKIIVKSGKQRMLSQRIAKYYIAYQAGIKDKNTVNQMENTVENFSNNHNSLIRTALDDPELSKKFEKVDRLWKVVYKFYLNIEKGGLPFIVYTSTDDITRMMNNITQVYINRYK